MGVRDASLPSGQNNVNVAITQPWVTATKNSEVVNSFKFFISIISTVDVTMFDLEYFDNHIPGPRLEFSTTSTPNWTISPENISWGSLSSAPLLRRTLFMNVPLLLFVSCRKNYNSNNI